MNKQKKKSLHHIVINECNFNTRLFYNLNTDHIGIGTEYTQRKKYCEINKENMKQYRNNHKNEKIKYDKQYYINHPRINFLGKTIQTDLPKLKKGCDYHHVIYDHLNKDRYVIPMTRLKHSYLHWQMKHKGIEIQHINVRVNDFKGF